MANRSIDDTQDPAVITFTANTTDDSDTLASPSSTAGLAVGQLITGVGILPDTTIETVTPSLTMSRNASNTATGATIYAYPAGDISVVPPTPSDAVSRSILYADGAFRAAMPPWLYNFDNPRTLRHYRVARDNVWSRQPLIANATNNGPRTIIYHTDNEGSGSDGDIPHSSYDMSPVTGMIMSQRTGGAFRSEYVEREETGTWDDNHPMVGFTSFRISTTEGSTVTLRPRNTYREETSWDRCTLMIRGTYTFAYSIDGGAEDTLSATTADQINIIEIEAGVDQLQDLVISIPAAAGVIVGPAMFWQSATPQMRWLHLGGGPERQVAQNGAGMTAMFNAARSKILLNPCLAILHWGYSPAGDQSSPGTSAATMVANWKTNMGVIIAEYQAQDIDVILMSMHHWDSLDLYKDQASPEMVRRASYELADEYNIGLIDNFLPTGDRGEMSAAGMISHYARPLPALAWDNANRLAQALSMV